MTRKDAKIIIMIGIISTAALIGCLVAAIIGIVTPSHGLTMATLALTLGLVGFGGFGIIIKRGRQSESR